MATVQEIESKVADYLAGDYEIRETETIPTVENVPFGKVAYKVKIAVLYLDLRNSTSLLFVHEKQTAGKIHKAFLHAAASVIVNRGGFIRGFKGDSIMALWPAATKTQVNNCVRAALEIKWLLDVKLSKYFEAYEKIDFGIGVEWGEVYVLRAGISRDANNNDLVFMGECVNYGVRIGEQAKGPNHVEITPKTHQNLDDSLLYGVQNGQRVHIWTDGQINFKGEARPTKLTSWYGTFG